nr:ras-related protein Rab-6-like [Lepeophtheirus salmonis]
MNDEEAKPELLDPNLYAPKTHIPLITESKIVFGKFETDSFFKIPEWVSNPCVMSQLHKQDNDEITKYFSKYDNSIDRSVNIDEDRIFKLVVLGHYSVGKTSVVQRFCTDTFDVAEEPTIGAAFMTKSVVLGDTGNNSNNSLKKKFLNNSNSMRSIKKDSLILHPKRVKYNIWDTAGQERYRSLIPMYYRGSNASLIIFDLSSKVTLETARTWLESLRKEPFLKILVGNKCDLKDARQVSWNEGSGLASEFECLYFEVSAKSGSGVRKLFNEIGEILWKDVENNLEKEVGKL